MKVIINGDRYTYNTSRGLGGYSPVPQNERGYYV